MSDIRSILKGCNVNMKKRSEEAVVGWEGRRDGVEKGRDVRRNDDESG